MKPNKLNKLTLWIAIMAVLFLCTQSITADESQSRDDAEIIATIENTINNVVTIGKGSGFYINPTTVVTNLHVVLHEQNEGQIGINTYQGELIIGNIIDLDTKDDWAVIQVPHNPNVRTLQTARAKVGQTVLSLGSPRLNAFSATKGMISYVDRPYKQTRQYQVDANINGGQSGSMLITTDGFLIGVIVQKMKDIMGIGFAIPIELIKY